MTRGDIARLVAEIEAIKGDDEAAHAKEDDLYSMILHAICDGICDDPPGCCAEALRTKDIKFARHCA
jgi:hypothetical protein